MDGKYISSRRASELSGYTQDYIGQLARAGHIDAQRISGLWHVVLDSLLNHKQNADLYIPTPPLMREKEADDSVALDGRHYVSSARAAKITGYNMDYVGQLARAGKILSRQIGSRWYVEREGLVAHKKEKDALLAAVQKEAVGLTIIKKGEETPFQKIESSEPFFKYIPEQNNPLPSQAQNKVQETTKDHATEDAHKIKIRALKSSVGTVEHVPTHIYRQYSTSTNRQPKTVRHAKKGIVPGKTILLATVSSLTIVIVLGLGIKTISGSGLYAGNRKDNPIHQEFLGNATTALESAAALLEKTFIPQQVFQREN